MNELELIANIKENLYDFVYVIFKCKDLTYKKKYNSYFSIYKVILKNFYESKMIIHKNIYRLSLIVVFNKIIKLDDINYILYYDINYYHKYNIIYKNETVFSSKDKMQIDKLKNSKHYTNNKLYIIYYKFNNLCYNRIKFNYLNNSIKLIKIENRNNTVKMYNYYIKNSKVFIFVQLVFG